jgi:hypothetical protein
VPFNHLFCARLLAAPDKTLTAEAFIFHLQKLANYTAVTLGCEQPKLRAKDEFCSTSTMTDACLTHERSPLTTAIADEVKSASAKTERERKELNVLKERRGSEWNADIDTDAVPSAKVKVALMAALPDDLCEAFKKIDFSYEPTKIEDFRYRPSREEKDGGERPPPDVRDECHEEEFDKNRCAKCMADHIDAFCPKDGGAAAGAIVVKDIDPVLLRDDPALASDSKWALNGWKVELRYSDIDRLTYFYATKPGHTPVYDLPDGHAAVMHHCTPFDGYRAGVAYREDDPRTWTPFNDGCSYSEAMSRRVGFQRAYFSHTKRCPQHGLTGHWGANQDSVCRKFSEDAAGGVVQMNEGDLDRMTDARPVRPQPGFDRFESTDERPGSKRHKKSGDKRDLAPKVRAAVREDQPGVAASPMVTGRRPVAHSTPVTLSRTVPDFSFNLEQAMEAQQRDLQRKQEELARQQLLLEQQRQQVLLQQQQAQQQQQAPPQQPVPMEQQAAPAVQQQAQPPPPPPPRQQDEHRELLMAWETDLGMRILERMYTGRFQERQRNVRTLADRQSLAKQFWDRLPNKRRLDVDSTMRRAEAATRRRRQEEQELMLRRQREAERQQQLQQQLGIQQPVFGQPPPPLQQQVFAQPGAQASPASRRPRSSGGQASTSRSSSGSYGGASSAGPSGRQCPVCERWGHDRNNCPEINGPDGGNRGGRFKRSHGSSGRSSRDGRR